MNLIATVFSSGSFPGDCPGFRKCLGVYSRDFLSSGKTGASGTLYRNFTFWSSRAFWGCKGNTFLPDLLPFWRRFRACSPSHSSTLLRKTSSLGGGTTSVRGTGFGRSTGCPRILRLYSIFCRKVQGLVKIARVPLRSTCRCCSLCCWPSRHLPLRWRLPCRRS